MHFSNTTFCVSSLLTATASASTSASFEVPGSAPGTATAPQADTTTIYETSTAYMTSAITVTSGVSEIPSMINSTAEATKTGYAPPPEGYPVVTPIFPQNSTGIAIPTGHPANRTVTITSTASSSKMTATTTKDETSTTESASASVSEVPVNDAGKTTGNALLGMGCIAGIMALL